MVRRDVYRELGACSHSFLLNLEIPIRAKRGGYRVTTVYMRVHERIAGESRLLTSDASVRHSKSCLRFDCKWKRSVVGDRTVPSL